MARPWLMVAVLLLGPFMGLLDIYIVTVALPAIRGSLHATGAELQLVIGGYVIAYAMLLITGARLGELYGRRRMYLIGGIGFTLSSLVCGLAPSVGVLVAFRIGQGASAALMVPQVFSVIQMQFTGKARAKALSAYAAVLSIGGICGLLLGGVLVGANLLGAGWRPVFLVNVPLGVLLAVLVPLLVPADRPASARRLDLAGLAVVTPATVLIVLPLVLGREAGWPAWMFASMAAGVALAVVFVLVERRVADPLVDLSVLRVPGMPSGLVTLVGLMTTYGGFLFTFAPHLQAGLGHGPLRAALGLLPFALVFGSVAFFWRSLPERLHPVLAPLGMVVCILALLCVTEGGALTWVGLGLYGAGLGASTCVLSQAVARVPRERAADASGLLTSAMQLGQAIGVAVFGAVFLTVAGPLSPATSTHAMTVTAYWLALTTTVGIAAAAALARAVLRAPR